MAEKILIVDDDEILRESLTAVLENRGYSCVQAEDGVQGYDLITGQEFDVVISDIEMPRMGGFELMERVTEYNPRIPFIIVTAYASMETAINALRKGAFDYLIKPLNFEDVYLKIEKLLKHKELVSENQILHQELNTRYNFDNMIGRSPAIQTVFETIRRVAETESNVLITGKSGTGKELVARSIHYNSHRTKGRLVPINCASIAETLFESELFGHKKGAFTGAVSDAPGLFKSAAKGTLFLDEISEVPLTTQAKLLRVIESKEIVPVGSNEPEKIDVRIIAASNRDLAEEVKHGNFREDLFYRLNIIHIQLPTLSERPEDIPLLVNHFIHNFRGQMNRCVTGVDPDVMQALTSHHWQGEIRELQNVIERAMIFCKSETITLNDLPQELTQTTPAKSTIPPGLTLKQAVEEFEKSYIQQELRKNNSHRAKTAKALGIGEATLYRKMGKVKNWNFKGI
ncbi:Fis family transcriptional regulator [candidate division KSB1 bacterium 4572_119]|nr:MAG: Fis family transcriptional regulator [candidate division KSB1 bacterium 4572_119]